MLATVNEESQEDAMKSLVTKCRELGQSMSEFRAQHEALLEKYYRLRETAEAMVLEYKRRERMAFKDQLTELLNRHGFDEFYTRICAEEERSGERELACVAIIDIDKFKVVNDTYGHPIGDRVLKALAMAIQGETRKLDLVCRFGGEEFMVFLHKTTKEEARQLMERVRRQIEQKLVVTTSTVKIQVTVSIGVAECQPNEMFDETYTRADRALYDAKHTGRNKVICAL